MSESGELRLLVVDDQASIREALATMLDMTAGLQVVGTASDGEQAIAAVQEHRPDVVLMDLRMPKMDGIAATAQITARFPDVAVVVLTTFDDDSSIVAALGAGARGYLTKQAGRADIARALQAAAAGQAVLDPAVQARLVAAANAAAPAGTAADVAAPVANAAARVADVAAPVADVAARVADVAAPVADVAAPVTTVSVPQAVPSTLPAARPVGPHDVPAAGPQSARDSAPGALEQLSTRERQVLALIAGGRSNSEIAAQLFVSPATVKTHINNIFAKIGVRDRAQAVHFAFTRGLV